MKRLFVGIELSSVARLKVAEVQDRLREVATRQGVRFVRPEKIHLTLVFLGDLPDESVDVIDVACRPACQTHLGFSLTAKGLGGFPDLRRPKVLWVGVEGDLERLRFLHADLARSLSDHAEVEDRDYSPHLTLARISPGSKEVGWLARGVSESLGEETIAQWSVSEVVLFESTADGRYEAVRRWPLADSLGA